MSPVPESHERDATNTLNPCARNSLAIVVAMGGADERPRTVAKAPFTMRTVRQTSRAPITACAGEPGNVNDRMTKSEIHLQRRGRSKDHIRGSVAIKL